MKKLVAIIVCFAMLINIAACQVGNDKAESKIAFWSTSNSDKILLDLDYDENLKNNKSVSIEMAKGEYENGQLIVTAETDINNIKLSAADLKDANGNILSAKNIEILFEKYVDITFMSSPNSKNLFGQWPDALVPMQNIIDKGENIIQKGNNQGFFIKVYTPIDTVAGTYKANFMLEYDDKSTLVPVEVKVWDFEVPQETHSKSSFHNTRDYIMQGELDGSEEMYTKYYDQLLDYRVSVNFLPVFDTEVSSYVEQAKKYAADPRSASYNLTNKYTNEHVYMEGVIDKFIPNIDYDHMKETLKELAKESTESLNLLKKLYVYDIAVDEPEGTNRVEDANYKQIMHVNTLEATVAELNSENFDWTAHGLTETDILKIEFVVTGRYINSMSDIRTYTPLTSSLQTAAQREFYKNFIKEGKETGEDEYRTLWWYVAWEPQYPLANYRIDESSLGSRVLSWMQKDYGIDGLLYWGTSVYPAIPDPYEGQTVPRDVWNDPYSFHQRKVTSDGCLTYPGKPYGVDGFISSIRLESVRDGMEDYEYLWLLEQLIAEASEKYEQDFNYDIIMNSIFEKLYTDVIPNYLNENFVEARREVAAMIELLSSDMNSLVFVDKIDSKQNTADLVIYAKDGVEVKINNVVLSGVKSGEGKAYTYTHNMTETTNDIDITFELNSKKFTINKYLGKKSNFIELIKNDNTHNFIQSNGHTTDPKNHIVLSKINQQIVGLSSSALKIDIDLYQTDNEMAQISYSPYVYIPVQNALSNISADSLDEINFSIYNDSSTNKTITVYLGFKTNEISLKKFVLTPGINQIKISQIYLNSWSNLKLTDKIKIVFEKSDNLTTYYLDNMYYTVL